MGGLVNTTTKPDTALSVPTVWACVNLLAGAVSSLKLDTFRRVSQPDAVPERLPDSTLIARPDGPVPQSQWLHMLMVSLLINGNAFGLLTRDPRTAQVSNIHLLNPDMIDVRVDPDTGAVTYHWRNRNGQQIDPNTLWHLPGLTLPGDVVGRSPISYAAATLGLDLASRRFANGFFEGDGVPKAIIESDQQLNQSQAVTIKDRFMSSVRGREPMVMGMGLKYTAVQVKPEESQFLKTQEFNVAQIAKFFGVPAAMVDGPSGHGMTYTNVEMRGIDFLTYSLAPWLKRIEDGMFSLLPGTQYVQFEVKNLLRLDAHTQSQVDILDIAGKVVVPSEIRARRGLPPMTEAQQKEADMVPLTISPLGRPAALPALHEPPGPSAGVPISENPSGA
jgi:HK97 family phage portal protein